MTYETPNTIALRCYTEKPSFWPRKTRRPEIGPSDWSVIFDTETTIDAAQSLRIGFYQIRRGDALFEEGVFYQPGALTPLELALLHDYCAENRLRLRSVGEFNAQVLLRIGYERRGTIIGFNLPFDLSRIALSHGEARGDSMRGGFSFKLVESPYQPAVRVKHLSRSAAMFDFASPATQETARSDRKKGRKTPAFRGHFVDVKTIASALRSRSFDLRSLCEALGTQTQKQEVDEHGGPLIKPYLDYARADVQATWECYRALKSEYERHGLDRGLHKIISEASLGKAYLQKMGVKPLLETAEIERVSFGPIMSAYYGGRAEVRLRRVISETIYTDFKSMYPSVNALMGLWRFVVAKGYTERDGTDEVRALLASIERSDLQKPETWRSLVALVRIKPDKDLLPVRAPYDGDSNTIGLNNLTYDGSLWYALPDVIAAKVLTGKMPDILEARIFEPGPPQDGLESIKLFGDATFKIDPIHDDLFVRLIDLRDQAKAKRDDRQLAIKILANSTAYGIYIEMQRDNASKKEPIKVAGPDGVFRQLESTALEQPGSFFHPILGVMITAAARLMLALAEAEAEAQGLDWAFCDTDSLAIARPDGMSRSEFQSRAKAVVDWFEPLNPYAKPGSILQIEDLNFDADGRLQPLYAFAISAKRYALFNLDRDHRPIIRKASAHGLGHLSPPYGDDDPAHGVPDPIDALPSIGVRRWQYDYWFHILKAAIDGHPNKVSRDYHSSLKKCAAMRYGATSPGLLKWMAMYNGGKRVNAQVRPFGFMMTFMVSALTNRVGEENITLEPPKPGRPSKRPDVRPVASYNADPETAARSAFCRLSGEAVERRLLRTYVSALRAYHLSPEPKFENASFRDQGRTVRRHVVARFVQLIGKEANGVGEFGEQEDPTMLVNAVYQKPSVNAQGAVHADGSSQSVVEPAD